MKIRHGFVSNSSSTAFVVSPADFSLEQQSCIESMVDYSDELSRCTGRISDIDEWLRYLQQEVGYDDFEMDTYFHAGRIRELMEKYHDIVILRESDEQAGGEFSDYGLSYDEVEQKALVSFECH